LVEENLGLVPHILFHASNQTWEFPHLIVSICIYIYSGCILQGDPSGAYLTQFKQYRDLRSFCHPHDFPENFIWVSSITELRNKQTFLQISSIVLDHHSMRFVYFGWILELWKGS
jgi:hypothetical protein